MDVEKSSPKPLRSHAEPKREKRVKDPRQQSLESKGRAHIQWTEPFSSFWLFQRVTHTHTQKSGNEVDVRAFGSSHYTRSYYMHIWEQSVYAGIKQW